ncbi:TraR/DksA family transcriptional regulator [Pseudogulbenkiania sp. MAI-1]|uniref:TraR/DksA family transcriptional regulator n=1 Tax=Pseudogulbenkiania sp. MAI-1 TaxID=990370 RepID=UPI00045E757F|nr:TraR/DksA family transcriptional regulator [Pseudogulbenkiania sp. MAI-1]
MDPFDRAQELEMEEREAAIAAARDLVGRGVSASECDDCGVPIPPARQLAAPGCTRCVDCQNVRERSRR